MTKFNFLKVILFGPALVFFLGCFNSVNAQQLRFISNTGPKKVKVFYTPFLPANTMLVDSLSVDKEGSISFNLDKPAMAMLYVDMLMPFTIYLHPKHMATVTFTEKGVEFSQPNAYYQDKKQQAGFTTATSRTFMLPDSLDLKRSIEAIDGLYKVESVFLDVQRNALPVWFYDREKVLLKLQAHTAKLIAANKKRANYTNLLNADPGMKEVIKVPADADINFQPEYYMYLSFYFFKASADDDAEPYPVRHSKVLQAMKAAKLPAKTIENYHVFWLSYVIPTVGNANLLNDYARLWQTVRPSVSDRASLLLIDGMIKGKANELNNVAALKSNSAVPDIDFEDKNGNKVSLAKWKGKWIYLDFWATWCAPCRIDMAKKKELGFDQLGDGIVLVNVCTDSKRDAWLKTVAEMKPLGIDLYADNGVKDQLLSGYQIKGFPHYVIIRPDGKVEQNGASGPSQAIDYLRKNISSLTCH